MGPITVITAEEAGAHAWSCATTRLCSISGLLVMLVGGATRGNLMADEPAGQRHPRTPPVSSKSHEEQVDKDQVRLLCIGVDEDCRFTRCAQDPPLSGAALYGGGEADLMRELRVGCVSCAPQTATGGRGYSRFYGRAAACVG